MNFLSQKQNNPGQRRARIFIFIVSLALLGVGVYLMTVEKNEFQFWGQIICPILGAYLCWASLFGSARVIKRLESILIGWP